MVDLKTRITVGNVYGEVTTPGYITINKTLYEYTVIYCSDKTFSVSGKLTLGLHDTGCFTLGDHAEIGITLKEVGSTLRLHKLQGIGPTVETSLSDNILVMSTILEVIRELKDDIPLDLLSKKCFARIMINGKGKLNPHLVKVTIKNILVDNKIFL